MSQKCHKMSQKWDEKSQNVTIMWLFLGSGVWGALTPESVLFQLGLKDFSLTYERVSSTGRPLQKSKKLTKADKDKPAPKSSVVADAGDKNSIE